MIMLGANGEKIAYGVKHYNVDTYNELSKINLMGAVMGTTAFVIESSKYYMLNGSNEWKEISPFGAGGTGGGGGGSESGKEVIYDGGGV